MERPTLRCKQTQYSWFPRDLRAVNSDAVETVIEKWIWAEQNKTEILDGHNDNSKTSKYLTDKTKLVWLHCSKLSCPQILLFCPKNK